MFWLIVSLLFIILIQMKHIFWSIFFKKWLRPDNNYEFNEIICPFEAEWKFHKADLMYAKENMDLYGKCFYASNIPGLQYHLIIFPNRLLNEKSHGETWIFLHISGSKDIKAEFTLSFGAEMANEKKIKTAFDFSIDSAHYYYSNDHIFEGGLGSGKICGASCGKTRDFFDAKNKIFVNGEVTIKVKGIFKAQRPLILQTTCPISFKWKIKEEILKEIMNEVPDDGYLCSNKISVASFSDVSYYLSIHPNKFDDEAQTHLYLNIELGNEKKIKAACDFSIGSAYYYYCNDLIFVENSGLGFRLCSTADLFDASKDFISNGYFTINLNGILITEKNQFMNLKCKKSMVPKSSLKNDDKDFLIVIGEKEIPIHKQMLSDVSPVFDGMLKSGMKEAVENKMIIVDFPFKIVDAAINLLYDGRGTCKFVLADLLLLYVFADKYRIQFIMDFAEYHLIKHISPSNVVQLTKFSDPNSFNVAKLHESCKKFLIKCFKKEIPVYASECLDKDLVFQLFINGFCPTIINKL